MICRNAHVSRQTPGSAGRSDEERDVSRSYAMMTHDVDATTSTVSDNMNGWHSHFSNKYIICGELVEDPDNV